MNKSILYTITISLVLHLNSLAQWMPDTLKPIRYLVVPILFKTPEVGVGFGASGSATFKIGKVSDTLTRLSTIQAFGFFTTRYQNVQAIDATLNFPKQNFIFLSRNTHSYFPDNFWGIGPNTNDHSWERYTYEHVHFSNHLKKRFAKQLFVGLLADYQNVYRIISIPNGIFDNSTFEGKSKYQSFGIGGSIGYDSRDNPFWPEKGLFLNSQLASYNKGFISDYSFIKWHSDIRYFKKIVEGHILAIQLMNYQTIGDTPLRDLAALGGADNLRGFYQGRYRAKNLITFISEYRANIYKRLSVCIFAGVGNIYNSKNELLSRYTKFSFGGGLRYALLKKDKIHVRLDYGYSNKFNNGIYFTIGECF